MSALDQLLCQVEGLYPTGVLGDGMVARLHELAARVRAEHRAELEQTEWSGTRRGPGDGPHGSGRGHPYPACPECGGLREPNNSFVDSAVGHRSGCTIAAALGRPTVVPEGETGRLAL